MQRVLFTIPFGGGIPVFGYGLFLMIGFVATLLLAIYRGKKRGFAKDPIVDVGIISILAGIIGARVAYLLLDYTPTDGNYGNFREWIAVWQGGLTFQGGLVLALLCDLVYLRCYKIPAGKIFDIYAPALAVGVGFGRLGCLLNGCCWGKPAPYGSLLAMRFPDNIEPMAQQHWLRQTHPDDWWSFVTGLGYPPGTPPPIPIYATQIVSAVGLFLIALILIWLERKYPRRPDGQTIIWFIMLYSIGRFIIEFYRDDTPLRYGLGIFPGLRLGQWLALAMFVIALALQWRLGRKPSPAGGDDYVPDK